ncbi:MAG TPA: helix-turn-helix domain-containing protein, partial [Acidovorax defluvii]|nr:helix-turn-helix domain-containing protein [Acidovorax defluvii]
SDAGIAAEGVFGLDLRQLLALAHDGRPLPQMLPSGLTLWIAAHLDDRVDHPSTPPLNLTSESAPGHDPATAPAPAPSLDEASRVLIEQTLAQCQGNVSRAARLLGVSRGLLYRRLREWSCAENSPQHPSSKL